MSRRQSAFAAACGLVWLVFIALQRRRGAQTLDSRGLQKLRTQQRRPRAFLHIGPHKTGTTFIQEMLCQKEQELARANIVLPVPASCQSGTCSNKNFYGVVHQLLQTHVTEQPLYRPRNSVAYGCASNPLQDLASALAVSNGSDVVISCEGFDFLGHASVTTLFKLLSPHFDPYIVVVYRDKLRHIMSYYAQWYKFDTPPITFKDFYWSYVSNIDTQTAALEGPDASPAHHVAEGLFLTRMVRTYGKVFGKDKFIVINYDAAGDKLWHVFADSVLGLPARAPVTLRGGGAVAGPSSGGDRVPTRVNVSPSQFALTVAAHYYSARWGVYGYDRAAFAPRKPPMDVPDPKLKLLPSIECVVRVLEGAATKIPKACTSLANVVMPWEREERETLKDLAVHGSKLVMFDEAMGNRVPGAKACDIDFEELMQRAQTRNRTEALLWTLQDASREIDAQCDTP